jgi:hypothetical protein
MRRREFLLVGLAGISGLTLPGLLQIRTRGEETAGK